MRTVLFRHRALHGQNARMLYGTLCVEEARRTEVDQHSTPVQKIYDNGGKDRCYRSCRKRASSLRSQVLPQVSSVLICPLASQTFLDKTRRYALMPK